MLICQIIEQGVSKGEINSNVETEMVATIIISTLEGAIMMSKLYGDTIYLQRAVDHLSAYVETCL